MQQRRLIIENFLKIKRFETRRAPIIGLYGKNQVGKSTVAKLMYGLQDQYRKSFGEVLKPIFENKELPDWPKDVDVIIQPESSSELDEWVYKINKEETDYYFNRVREITLNQIASIPKYFISENVGEHVWNKLIPKGKECIISSIDGLCNVNARILKELPPSRRKGDRYIVDIKHIVKQLKITLKLSPAAKESLSTLNKLDFYEVIDNGKRDVTIDIALFMLIENKEVLMYQNNIDVGRKAGTWEINGQSILFTDLRERLSSTLRTYFASAFLQAFCIKPSFSNEHPYIIPSNRALSWTMKEKTIFDFNDGKLTLVERNYWESHKKSLPKYKNKRKENTKSEDIVEREEEVLNLLYEIQGKLTPYVRGEGNEMIFYDSKTDQEHDGSSLASSVIATADLNLFLDDFPPTGLLVYEEPEIHLHPEAIAELSRLLVKLHLTNNEFSIIFTTHSDYFMSYFLVYLAKHYSYEKISSQYSIILLEDDESSLSTSKEIKIGKRGFEINLYNSADLDLYNNQMTLWEDE